MAGATITTADGILKEFYVGGKNGPREQLNNATVLMAQINRSGEHVDAEGKEAVFPVHVSRNSGVAAMAEGDSLPAAGSQGSVKGRAPLKTLAGRARFSKQSVVALKSNRSAFRKQADMEMKGIITDLKRQQERMVHGTGDGKIATCGVTSASTTVQLATTTTTQQLRQLELDGIKVDVGTLAAPTLRGSSLTISAVDYSALTITVSSAITTAGTDFVSLAGSGGTNPTKELNGLQNIVNNTGDLHGISVSSYPVWKSVVNGTVGTNRPTTEALFKRAADDVDVNGGGGPDLIVTGHGVERALSADLLSRVRFTSNVKLKGGYQGIELNLGTSKTTALVRTRDCPPNMAFLVDTDEMFIAEWQPWDWFDDDGQIIRAVADKLELEAIFHGIFELCTYSRRSHARVQGLSES